MLPRSELPPSPESRHGRRGILLCAILLLSAALLVEAPLGAQAEPPPNPPLPAQLVAIASQPVQRRDIRSLSAAQLATFRQAVRTLRGRTSDNPRGWQYQANMHWIGPDSPTPNPQALQAWSQCPHGRPYFLAWHRVYLFFLERLLKEAVNSPTLSLPYWNYVDLTNRALPLPYRSPQEPPSTTQSLFVADRAFQFNSPVTPSLLPDLRAVTQSALNATTFYNTNLQGFQTRLEQSPHNTVHVVIGGQGNDIGHLMGYIQTAARDPIFWMHHGNIDRLWACWQALNRPKGPFPNDPVTQQWLTTPRVFFDSGNRVWTLNGSQILALANTMNVTYDNTSNCGTGFALAQGPVVEAAAEPVVTELGTAEGLVLAPGGNRAKVSLSDAGQGAVAEAAGTEPEKAARVVLTLRGISIAADPRVTFVVKISLPPQGVDAAESAVPHLEVGRVSFFGILPPPDAEGHAHGAEPFDYQVDITDAVRELAGNLDVRPETISVSIEPDRGVEGESAAEAGRYYDTRAKVTIKQIVVQSVR